ncbi:hypothetical protein FQA39_LY07646 [Lamprigera yunnana]|nr:hypothetical protein FQA39_LY07646 [Lamprigera yunnana]
MHSRGKKLVNLAILEGNKQVDNNATPTGNSEVQMNDDFNDFGSDDSVADKDYVPSPTSSSESELDVGGKRNPIIDTTLCVLVLRTLRIRELAKVLIFQQSDYSMYFARNEHTGIINRSIM